MGRDEFFSSRSFCSSVVEAINILNFSLRSLWSYDGNILASGVGASPLARTPSFQVITLSLLQLGSSPRVTGTAWTRNFAFEPHTEPAITFIQTSTTALLVSIPQCGFTTNCWGCVVFIWKANFISEVLRSDNIALGYVPGSLTKTNSSLGSHINTWSTILFLNISKFG